jgi:hypothetical protein
MKSVSLFSILMFALCGFWHATTVAWEGIEKAVVEKGVIKGATHYHLLPGGKTETYDSRRSPIRVEVEYSPTAFFYGYDHAQKQSNFLGRVDIKDFDPKTLAALNTMLDSQSKLPAIKSAQIYTCIKAGRVVRYLDDNGNEVDSSSRYYGSIDLKSEQHHTKLIQPHSLLNSLEQVTESKPPSLLLGLLGKSNTAQVMRYK